jgi:acyl-CoA synthetase (NDP forming)
VVLLYLESLGNPRRFARLAKRVGRVKPVVALKAGRTAAGRQAAGSHTAALAASDVAVDALFRQSGVIRAETIDEMFDVAACLDAQPLPNGAHVAVLTNGGGPGILAADACEAAGLTVVELVADTRARLAQFLSPSASVRNPVDMVASAGGVEYRRAIETLLAAREVDALIIIFTPVDNAKTPDIMEGIRHGIADARASGAIDKPIVACLMAEDRRALPLQCGVETIPVYAFPENAARALAKVAAYATWRARPAGLFWTFDNIDVEEARAICRAALAARGDGWLTTKETHGVLQAFGIPVVGGSIARSADQAASVATELGFPVAAKLASADVPHKTDLGVVQTNLANTSDVRRAFDDIMSRARRAVTDERIEGVLIQPMVVGGVETLIGVARDTVFGPLVGFGLGGTHVELMGDVRFRVAPLTDHDADELLRETRGARLLDGYRGQPGADIEALREVVLRVSRLAEDIHEIRELDLNPVIALTPGQGCRIVDARIRVAADVPSPP